MDDNKIGFNWSAIVKTVGNFLKLSPIEASRLSQNDIATFIAGIPFWAGCKNPAATALSHVTILLFASSPEGKAIFAHNESHDSNVYKRMSHIFQYDGGDKAIIERGMAMLALAQIEDYQSDLAKDDEAEKYNPLSSGAWDYKSIKSDLLHKIKTFKHQFMDIVLPMESITRGWWMGRVYDHDRVEGIA